MSKLLYITCNIKPVDHSHSLSVGKEFLEEYRRLHPDDEIQAINLYHHDIQRIDMDVLNGWGKMRTGQMSSFTADEKQKIDRLNAHAGHFASFDKYVFVTPMWNLGFPAELKMYIDAICIAGKTFQYTPTGPVGLLKDKKCLHIHSSGGYHFGKEEDHSAPYLKSILNFMGIHNLDVIPIEGMDIPNGKAEETKKAAIGKALAVAAQF